MSVIQTVFDSKDTLDLFRPQNLYLKPISRLNVSVQLPQLKKSGAKISNWEVMERVKEMARPFNFSVFKVAKSSLEFIRFEAEIENYGSMDQVLAKLDMKAIKLSGFHELLKVRAAEARPPFPSREDWDSFFNDNKSMDPRKPGERPDTLHVQNLPTKWFVDQQDRRSGAAKDRPSELVLKKVFSAFGEIRTVDIPMLDPYRDKMKASISGIQTFTFGQDLVFEAYVQYKEYIGFIKAMNSLKGMKLLYKDRYEERSWVANIKVDFDKSKHLSEASIKLRAQVRERLVQKEREKDEEERRRQELEELKRADELRRTEEEQRQREKERLAQLKVKERRRREREERRRQQMLERRRSNNPEMGDDDEAIARKIAVEERKLLVAQRKLESIRLLDELLERVKAERSKVSVKSIEADLLETAAKEANKRVVGKAATILAKSYKDRDEKFLRDKLVTKLKQREVNKMGHLTQKLRHVKGEIDGHGDGGDQSMEEISDQELTESNASDALEDISDANSADLKLTSSTDEEEFEEKQRRKKEKKFKKKEKKKRKKERKDKRKDKEEERKKKKKREELQSQISLAQRISERERRSRSREARRNRRSREEVERRGERSKSSNGRQGSVEDGYPDYRARRAEERARRRLEERMAAKRHEMAKEEMYDRMINPHLYGTAGGGGGYRRIKPGEHYEEVQKKELEEEIRERERRERIRRREQQERQRHERDYRYGSRHYHSRHRPSPYEHDSRHTHRMAVDAYYDRR